MKRKLEWKRDQNEEAENIYRFYKIKGYTLGIAVKKREKFSEWVLDLCSTSRGTYKRRRIGTYDSLELAEEKAEWFIEETDVEFNSKRNIWTYLLALIGILSLHLVIGFGLVAWAFHRHRKKADFLWPDENLESENGDEKEDERL